MKKAKSKKQKTRDVGGTIAWHLLTEKERKRFVDAFCTDKARSKRRSFLQKKKGFDHDVSSLLHHYQACIALSERIGGNAPSSDMIKEIRSMSQDAKNKILTLLWQWACAGEWERFKWLANYGMKNCKAGILKASPKSENCFPDLSVLLEQPRFSKTKAEQLQKTALQLPAVILRIFAKLSGLDYRHLAFFYTPPTNSFSRMLNPYLSKQSQDTQRRRNEDVPKALPTKGHLARMALNEWAALTGSHPKKPSSLIGRTLKKLGLGGLPAASCKKPFPRGSLSETGMELWESLGR